MTTHEAGKTLIGGLSSVIRGKGETLELFAASFLAGGHVLVEDAPGLGKTTLAKTLARLVANPAAEDGHATFRRIQFTPDLLPYDITGVDVFNAREQRFDFSEGPVFCDILLADEINRTTPKVQSALLEVMAERQVTANGTTRSVSPVFFVVATQNPVETTGTYPLPTAQLDRFMMRLSLGYPDEESERAILHEDPSESVLPSVSPIITREQLLSTREEQKDVYCHPELERTIVSIIRQTREHQAIRLGVSPRGALAILHAARALALVRGRDWIEDIDIERLAEPVLAHRIITKEQRSLSGEIVSDIARSCLKRMLKSTDWTKEHRTNGRNA